MPSACDESILKAQGELCSDCPAHVHVQQVVAFPASPLDGPLAFPPEPAELEEWSSRRIADLAVLRVAPEFAGYRVEQGVAPGAVGWLVAAELVHAEVAAREGVLASDVEGGGGVGQSIWGGCEEV